MFVFVIVNIFLALNAGLVHNAAIIEESSCASNQRSLQTSESSCREVETGCGGSVVEASTSSMSQSSSSSSTEYRSSRSSVEIDSLVNILNQCSFIDQKQWYLAQLQLCSQDELVYIQELLKYLNYGKPCFGDLDFHTYQQQFRSEYEILLKKNIYSLDVDLTTQQVVLDQTRNNLRQLLLNFPKNCFLYRPLNYFVEKNVKLLPFVLGLTHNVFNSQSTYYSQTTSSSTRSVSSNNVSQSYSSSSVEISSLTNSINQCSALNAKNWYVAQLQSCSQDELVYIQDLVKHLNYKEACFGDLDYATYQAKFQSAYEILERQNIYSVGVDLVAQKTVLEEARNSLRQIFTNFPQNSFLYQPLNYAIEKNLNLLPLVLGLTHNIFKSQSAYYSQTTSSSTRSVSSSSVSQSYSLSSVEISSLTNSINQCSALNVKDWYVAQLQSCSQDELVYIQDLVKYLNYGEACFGDLDYATYQAKFQSAYEILERQNIYSVGVDLVAQKTILEEARNSLRQIFTSFPRNSFLYQPLNYAIEKNLNLLPLVLGLTHNIFKSQSTYYSQTTSTSSTSIQSNSVSQSSVSQSSSTVVNSEAISFLEQSTFFSDVEKRFYLEQVRSLSAEKYAYLSGLIPLFNSQSPCLDGVDFASVQQLILSNYELLKSNSCFDLSSLAAKQAILNQIKSSMQSVISSWPNSSALYKAWKFCLEEDINYLPLVCGWSNALFKSQASYYASSSSSSTSRCFSSSSSYQQESVSSQSSTSVVESACAC